MDEIPIPSPSPNHQSVAKTENSTTASSSPPKPSPLLQTPVTIAPFNSQQSKPQLPKSPLQILETQRLLALQQQQQYRLSLQEQINGSNLRKRIQGLQMSPPSMSIGRNQMMKNGDVDSQLGMMMNHQDCDAIVKMRNLLSQKNYSQVQKLLEQQSRSNQLPMMKQMQLGGLASQDQRNSWNGPANDVVAELERRMKEQDARIDDLKIRQRELCMGLVICVLVVMFMILWVQLSVERR